LEQPSGIGQEDRSRVICHLEKPIFSLKQALRQKHEMLNEALMETWATEAEADPGLYSCIRIHSEVHLCVEDVLIAAV